MKIGILVNTDKHLEDVGGLVNASILKGHEVIIFVMDRGVKLLEDSNFTKLCKLNGVTVSFCNHDSTRFGANKTNIPPEVVCGSQYNNAVMFHESDRVIVL